MYTKRMEGVVIAAITPMNEDGSVDYQGVADFAEYLVQAGVNCLYPNGTNGESLILTREEREKIAEIFVKVSNGRVPVFIQCGAMTTAEAASHAQHAVKIGADGIGVMTPAFVTTLAAAIFLARVSKSGWLKDMLKGIRPCVLGVIAAAVVFFADTSVFTAPVSGLIRGEAFGVSPAGLAIFVCALVVEWRWKPAPVWLLAASAAAGVVLGL